MTLDNYTEDKSKLIADLHRNVEVAGTNFKAVQEKVSRSERKFNDTEKSRTLNDTNKSNADKGNLLHDNLLYSITHIESLSKKNVLQSTEISDKMTKMLILAYESAEETISAAQITLELTKMITKTKVTHKLLSDLLIADVKNAELGADEAVTNSLLALNASVEAVRSSISLKEYSQESNQLLSTLIQTINKSGSGLKIKLDSYITDLHARSKDIKEKNSVAKKEFKLATLELTEASSAFDLSNIAYNAALAAVNLGS